MIRSTSLYRVAALALAMLLAAPVLAAQSIQSSAVVAPGAATPTIAEPAPLVGPVATSVGISRSAVAEGATTAIQDTPNRRDIAWMVLGGATVIVGSIVGGDGGTIIMITGGVIGLVGLWRYLQYS
jgi:hypothetical protein